VFEFIICLFVKINILIESLHPVPFKIIEANGPPVKFSGYYPTCPDRSVRTKHPGRISLFCQEVIPGQDLKWWRILVFGAARSTNLYLEQVQKQKTRQPAPY